MKLPAEKLPGIPEKHIVGFSGGADSQACALWVRQRFPAESIILLNSNAGGNEDPLTDGFIRWYSDNVFPVITVNGLVKDLGNVGTKPGKTRDRRQEFSGEDDLSFDRLAYIKGRFPSRKAQFCTEFLKLAPQRRWVEENLEGVEFDRYVGVRRDESQLRACAKDCEWDAYFKCMVWRPIASWSKKLVFQTLKEAGEEINPLYTMGFNRVGCAPCINSSKEDILNWSVRRPDMIDKIRVWESKVGRTFFAPMVPGKAINWIDEVVQWSKTTRGGQQYALPIAQSEAEQGLCVSKYGLCE